MKTKLVLLTLVSAFSLQPSALLAQGSLTPPGAPAPTMKTLAQIEPRTPISSAPFTITNGGSYYLTTNLTVTTSNAITIAANGVTLDLNGFTISSTAASATGYGILLTSNRSDITVLNGHINGGVTNNAGTYNGPGFQYGIYYSDSPPVNTRVAGVSVSGCLTHGIFFYTGDSTVVESCTVRTVGSYGIRASTIKSSVAVDCGGYAIAGDQVSDSRGQSTGNSAGLWVTSALNCYGASTDGIGISAYNAQNCSGSSGSSAGISAYTAQNCYGYSSSGTGLNAIDVAIGCKGYSVSGIGLSAYIANSCRVAHGTTNITFKYNMP